MVSEDDTDTDAQEQEADEEKLPEDDTGADAQEADEEPRVKLKAKAREEKLAVGCVYWREDCL